MQIASQFDKTTQEKIKKSLLIGTSGFSVGLAGILMANPHILAYLTAHPIAGLAVASYLPVIINGINEWRKGQVDTSAVNVEPTVEAKPE